MRIHAAAEVGRRGMWLLRAHGERCVSDELLEAGEGGRGREGDGPDLVQAQVALDVLGELKRVARLARICRRCVARSASELARER